MIFFFAMSIASPAIRTRTFGLESTAEQLARRLQIVRCVDAQRHAANDHDIDAHAGIERPQLLESFALLVGRWRQSDEALQRRAAIGVETDMVIVRTIAARVRAREVFRLQTAVPYLPVLNLEWLRVGTLSAIDDHGGTSGDVN